MDSGILGFGIRNTAQEIRNPTAIGIQNPSSTDREGIQHLESGIHGLKSMLEMMDLARCSPFTQFLTVCRAATSCLWNAVFVHVQIQLLPNRKCFLGASLLRRCPFGLSHRLFTVPYFSVRSSRSKTALTAAILDDFFFKSTLSTPSPDCYNPDARPLGTYQTKMGALTGNRSIVTILQKDTGLVNSLLHA